MFDVVACGEMLVDFVALEQSCTLAEARTFEKAAGGAPANVAVGVRRLGHSAGFLGQVGDDEFGRFLAATLDEQGVDVRGLRFTADARTALAFVSRLPGGERDFMFYRQPSADMLWRPEDVDFACAAGARVFHHGSISLISEPSRSATRAAIAAARAAGALISYDPNIRPALWPDAVTARAVMLDALRQANIVKLSRDELAFLTGDDDPATGAARLRHDALRLLVVTDGAGGCDWFTANDADHEPAIPVQAVDTTGAGDAFVAGLLAGLLETGLRFDRAAVVSAVRLASATGALTTIRRGAIPALPDRAAVDRLRATVGNRADGQAG